MRKPTSPFRPTLEPQATHSSSEVRFRTWATLLLAVFGLLPSRTRSHPRRNNQKNRKVKRLQGQKVKQGRTRSFTCDALSPGREAIIVEPWRGPQPLRGCRMRGAFLHKHQQLRCTRKLRSGLLASLLGARTLLVDPIHQKAKSHQKRAPNSDGLQPTSDGLGEGPGSSPKNSSVNLEQEVRCSTACRQFMGGTCLFCIQSFAAQLLALWTPHLRMGDLSIRAAQSARTLPHEIDATF